MRQDWIRSEPEIRLDRQTVAKLVAPAFPSAEVVACEPARGGLANTTINVHLAAPPWHISLRLSQRDPLVLGKEEALNKLLLAHGVPTARFLYTAANNEITHSPYALLEWVQGEGLDRAILTLGGEGEARIGREIGAMFAKIHAITFERHGYLDSTLRVCAPIDLSYEGLLAFLRQNLVAGVLAERLGPLRAGLLSFIEREGQRLDPWLARACLVHADFNGSNVLVRREEGGWRLAGVIDWEFALSATPALDFGNLLRAPLGERSVLIDAVAAAYRDHGGYLPKDWRVLARIADLYAWIDVLNQPDSAKGAIEDGLAIIAETINGSC